MNCKPGDLARIVRPYVDDGVLDLYVSIIRKARSTEMITSRAGNIFGAESRDLIGWVCEAHHHDFPRVIADECLRPINDAQGNEEFVVKARKSLPRKKPVTGPVTINARGEVEA